MQKYPPQVTHSLVKQEQTVSRGLSHVIDVNNFSNLMRLLPVTAYVLRFTKLLKLRVQRVRNPIDRIELNASEIKDAENLWIKEIQIISFPDESTYLAGNHQTTLPVRVRQFGLYLDDGIIRCKGRINNSTLSGDSKNPVLLPNKHAFVNLLIAHTHENSKHCGIRDITTIREKYWILRGRAAVKGVLRKCVNCRRLEGYPYKSSISPDLPDKRVSDDPPFTYTGLDFAGPLHFIWC